MKTLYRLANLVLLICCYTADAAAELFEAGSPFEALSAMRSEFDRLWKEYADEDVAAINELLDG